MSELVDVDNGKWDIARNVSPALAAALLEASDEGPEGIASTVDELIQQLEQLNAHEGGEFSRLVSWPAVWPADAGRWGGDEGVGAALLAATAAMWP